LPKHISIIKEIELSFKDNVFFFGFAALDYRNPEKYQDAYIFESFSND
jgi:hypothetical protein